MAINNNEKMLLLMGDKMYYLRSSGCLCLTSTCISKHRLFCITSELDARVVVWRTALALPGPWWIRQSCITRHRPHTKGSWRVFLRRRTADSMYAIFCVNYYILSCFPVTRILSLPHALVNGMHKAAYVPSTWQRLYSWLYLVSRLWKMSYMWKMSIRNCLG